MLLLQPGVSCINFSRFWFQFCNSKLNDLHMKRFFFIQVAVLALLVVSVASCGVPMATTDDYYDQAPRANVYYGDPYYGSVNTIIVERDPYTGRYYQVSPGYGTGVYGAPAYGYGRRQQHYGGGRYYNNNNRNYNNNRNNSNNRNYNSNT